MTTVRSRNPVLERAGTAVRAGLAEVNVRLRAEGIPELGLEGKLIRPVVALGGAGEARTEAFWYAVGAVQMAHEASLIHDDILDEASERRGRSTVARSAGVKRALVQGDHLLTGSYRLAAWAGGGFPALFARAVERTVAGEIAQGRAAGRRLSRAEYESITGGKSGELLGCALAAGASLRGDRDVERRFELGRRIGVAYQMLDDLLDYLPGSMTGKPALQDYRNRHWTWPLESLGVDDFDAPVSEIVRRLFEPRPGGSAAWSCLRSLEARFAGLRQDVLAGPGGSVVAALLDDWTSAARTAVVAASAHESTEASPSGLLGGPAAGGFPDQHGSGSGTPSPTTGSIGNRHSPGAESLVRRLSAERWSDAMSRYAKSFSFASRLFPAAQRDRVADVYAVCRFMDEIADADGDPALAESELDEWLALCRVSWDGRTTGIAFLDRAMRDARQHDVPFRYVEDLAAGMRMDLHGTRYDTLADLEVYTYRVASVVGLWLTRLFGVRDPAVLDEAAALGRAMQLTNIVRDVGEDLERGRIYVPRDVLERHGLEPDDVRNMARTGRTGPEWRSAMEELVARAECDYGRAFAAMPALPAFFARPVAVAAEVYRGIHDDLRSHGFDNFGRRAHTTKLRKIRLAIRGLARLRSARRNRDGIAAQLAMAQARPASDHAAVDRRAVRTIARVGLAIMLLAAGPARATSQDGPMSHSSDVPQSMSEPTLEERLAGLEAVLARDPADTAAVFERLGTLWLMGVSDEAAVRAGLAALDTLEAGASLAGDGMLAPRALAYRGAFRALLGKHAFWPHQKLNHVLDGLAMMDRAVGSSPEDPQIRYLRLTTGFHLPGLFGRGEKVAADFAALASLLPGSRDRFPGGLYEQAVRFVLDNGELGEQQRIELERALGS